MNSNPENSLSHQPQSAEETLRIVASLPAPAGLEDRVHAALHVAPRRGRVLAWPNGLHPQSGWMRTAAAAAIVFVVAGGGWGVYTHVQQVQPARVIVMPARMPAAGGFSSAGAMRTPDTLPGPTAPKPVKPKPALRDKTKKPAGRAVSAGSAGNGHAAPLVKPALQPAASR
ncbi:MAG: hypothetical protein WBC92_15715 [Terracidiphilus sp.]